MDVEEWEDLIDSHAWYNGVSSDSPEKQKRNRAKLDATADK
jgi:hypothetical protein